MTVIPEVSPKISPIYYSMEPADQGGMFPASAIGNQNESLLSFLLRGEADSLQRSMMRLPQEVAEAGASPRRAAASRRHPGVRLFFAAAAFVCAFGLTAVYHAANTLVLLQSDLSGGGRGTGLERLVDWESVRAGVVEDLSEVTSPEAAEYLGGIVQEVAAGLATPAGLRDYMTTRCSIGPSDGRLRRMPLQVGGEGALRVRLMSCDLGSGGDIDATLTSAAFGLSWRLTRLSLLSPADAGDGY